MYAAHCPRHGSLVLLGLDDITRVESSATETVVEWECFCGWRGRTRTAHRRSPGRFS
jgi:hypothetical protein